MESRSEADAHSICHYLLHDCCALPPFVAEQAGDNLFPPFMEERKSTYEALSLLPEITKRWPREALAEDAKIHINVEEQLALHIRHLTSLMDVVPWIKRNLGWGIGNW